jgi:Uma2 family endonuclease
MAWWDSPRLEQAMPISEQTFKQIALEDPEGHWELHFGYLRRKPGMSSEHNQLVIDLAVQLATQLDRDEFRVRCNAGHVRRLSVSYYIPDVFIIPTSLERTQRGTQALEVYGSPLPLVVEIWSRSTGEYDVGTKLREYQQRGDLEIWLIHPYEHTLTAWRRQPDGSYSETHHSGGTIQPMALPNVTIDFDALFQ